MVRELTPRFQSREIEIRLREEPCALSPAGARNRALSDARGEWIYFADDDIFVPETLFESFAAHLGSEPDAVVLGGPNLTPPHSTLFQRASGLAMSSPLGTWQSVPRYRAVGPRRDCGEESLILCNLFADRSALGENPFVDTLCCGEENWLIRKLGALGRPMIYAPDLHVWHERRGTLSGFARQIFTYGRGRGQNLRLALGEASGFSPRYLLPSLGVIYSVGVACALLDGHGAAPMLGLPYLAYALACPFAAFARIEESTPARLLGALLFPVIHVLYGLGVLAGIARRP
jgi:hypothetical protein